MIVYREPKAFRHVSMNQAGTFGWRFSALQQVKSKSYRFLVSTEIVKQRNLVFACSKLMFLARYEINMPHRFLELARSGQGNRPVISHTGFICLGTRDGVLERITSV